MIELGKKQPLMVVNRTDFGVYLGNEEEKVLLPGKYVDPDLEIGDSITVFVYRDSSDRLIATTLEPLLVLGEVKSLQVKEVAPIGAFLNWGLEKDLFLPFKEQTIKVSEGKNYPVALYVDKSNRLCATMKVYPYLQTTDQYKVGDQVKGVTYEKIDRFGMFVAIDNLYQGLIPNKALYGKVEIGEEITATVTKVNPDGKIELGIRQPAYLQIHEDADVILEALKRQGGSLSLNDKSDPELIKEEFDMSKAAFKRACGNLLKEGKILISETGITLKK